MEKKRLTVDMCNGPILPKLLRLVLPMMLSAVLQLLFHAADIIVVGNFGSANAVAAVGSTGSLVNLLTNLFLGLSISTNVLTAQFIGARDDKGISKTIHNAIYLSLVSGVLLTTIGILFADKFLQLMGSPDDVRGLSATYLRIYFCGMTAMLIYNFGSSILRAKGDTQRPLYYLVIAGVINVLLNLFFVIGLKMDVAGVALATTLSQCVSAALILRCLMKESGPFKLSLKNLKPEGTLIRRILRIGIPASLEGVVFSLSNVVLQSAVNSFGSITMAGCASAASIEGFVWVAMNAFSQGALTFTSQNIGGAKYSRLNRIVITCCLCSGIAGLILGTLAYSFGPQLLSIYDPRPEIIAPGMIRMSCIARFYFLCGIMDIVGCSIRGMGYSTPPTVVSLLGACGLRLLWVFTLFQIPAFHTQEILFLSYPISWTATFIAHVVCYIFIRRRLPKTDGPIPRQST